MPAKKQLEPKIIEHHGKCLKLGARVEQPILLKVDLQIDTINTFCGGVFISQFPFDFGNGFKLVPKLLKHYIAYNKGPDFPGPRKFRTGFTKAFCVLSERQKKSLAEIKKLKGKVISEFRNVRTNRMVYVVELPLKEI